MTKNNIVIFFAIVAALLLYVSNMTNKIQAFIALAIVVAISFTAPLVGVVIIIPAVLVLYIKNYQQLAILWSRAKNFHID